MILKFMYNSKYTHIESKYTKITNKILKQRKYEEMTCSSRTKAIIKLIIRDRKTRSKKI